jgi:hypothetical protein
MKIYEYEIYNDKFTFRFNADHLSVDEVFNELVILVDWCGEHDIKCSYNMNSISFDIEADAMGFKLRWV